MKRLALKDFSVSSDFNLRAIATVEELSNYDMIYIYHHLHRGTILNLTWEETKLNGDLRYVVQFGQFKLGYVTISGIIKEFYEDSPFLTAEIEEMSKEKYLPIKAIDIKLKAIELKKVS